jgi:hypothetical protein
LKNIQEEYNEATISIKDHLLKKGSSSDKSWRLKGFIEGVFGAGILSFSPGWFMRVRDVSR